MYTTPQLILKYFYYFISASSSKGHGVHSPFVFDFITGVLNDRNRYYAYSEIERVRNELKENETELAVLDLGAGLSGNRKIKHIAQRSLKPPKYAQLLFRMVNYYQPASVIELGTSLGITTAYLAAANTSRQVYTLEGAPGIAALAQKNFERLRLSNIQQITGNFDDTLAPLLDGIEKAGFVFIDGNHRKEPTLRYFQQLLPYVDDQSILVFDDIHWSAEMEDAWKELIRHPSVTCSIDLFFIGIILCSSDFKEKQHFTIRF